MKMIKTVRERTFPSVCFCSAPFNEDDLENMLYTMGIFVVAFQAFTLKMIVSRSCLLNL